MIFLKVVKTLILKKKIAVENKHAKNSSRQEARTPTQQTNSFKRTIFRTRARTHDEAISYILFYYITSTSFSMKYLVMRKVYTDVEGTK